MTNDLQYSDRLRLFKNLCRYYKLNQSELERLEKMNLKKRTELEKQLLVFEKDILKDNILEVEHVLSLMETYGNENAKDILWDSYIECMPQDAVAKKYYLSVRTLQRMLAGWMREALQPQA